MCGLINRKSRTPLGKACLLSTFWQTSNLSEELSAYTKFRTLGIRCLGISKWMTASLVSSSRASYLFLKEIYGYTNTSLHHLPWKPVTLAYLGSPKPRRVKPTSVTSQKRVIFETLVMLLWTLPTEVLLLSTMKCKVPRAREAKTKKEPESVALWLRLYTGTNSNLCFQCETKNNGKHF